MGYFRAGALITLVSLTACGGARLRSHYQIHRVSTPSPVLSSQARNARRDLVELPLAEEAKLCGSISDRNTGEKLSGAIAVVYSAIGREKVVRTDARGRFEVAHLPPGAYGLWIEYAGVQKGFAAIRVERGKVTEVVTSLALQ